jgi:hypothetical protein
VNQMYQLSVGPPLGMELGSEEGAELCMVG